MIGELLPSAVDGLLVGVVYGLAAMGLSLIFGVMRVVNLAHGPLIALGMFGVHALFTTLGMNPFLALLPVGALGFLGGIVLYFAAVHPVRNAPHLSSLLSTFAVSMILLGVGTSLFTTNFRNVDYSLGKVELGTISIPGTRLAAAGVAVLVASGLHAFLAFSRPGKYVRAVANDREAAELVGIPSTWVLAGSFGLGTSLAAVAGGLVSILFPFTILSGGTYELKSFVIVVLGGLGNPLGALAGGLILGLVEGVVPFYLGTGWVPVIEFGLFVALLLVRPQGLFGGKK